MQRRRIEILPDVVRPFLRNVSVGLIVGGVLAIAISMPNWFGLFPFGFGIILGVIGCVRLEEAY